MERPPGYSATPGYDEDDDIHSTDAPIYSGSGARARLLQEMEEPTFRTPDTPNRAYQPVPKHVLSVSDLSQRFEQMSSSSELGYRQSPAISGYASPPPRRDYAPSPSISPTRGFQQPSASPSQFPYSPTVSRAETRGYAPSSLGRSSVEPPMQYPSSAVSRSNLDAYPTSSMAGSSVGPTPWTPSRRHTRDDWNRRAPSTVQYEPSDIHGASRAGTPSSIRSKRRSQSASSSALRPLPPAPANRYSGASDETAVPIHHHQDYGYMDDDDSAFGPHDSRASLDLSERTNSLLTDQTRSDHSLLTDRTRSDHSFLTDRTHSDRTHTLTNRTLSDRTNSLLTGSISANSLGSDLTARRTIKTDAEGVDPEKAGRLTRAKGEHFGPAPQAPQARRGLNREALMTKKQVKLINGELILDCKIPTILYSFLPRRDAVEFTHMRYTAVTCDPDDFVKRGYLLRQNMEPTQRETELFICITMYNEDEQCFTRTMHGVMRNIAHFCSRSKSRVWGKDGWHKIVVCIVADGRKKVHPRVLDALAAMGVYQAGIAKNLVNGRAVKAHVYEYTTQVSLDSDLKFKGAEKGIVPVQMIFCLKEQNKKKLNSHRWFFNAFGESLLPNVCILLDVGTKPGGDSLYHLWKAFDRDSEVGGACGEIKAMKGKGWMGLFNPLVASQNFEYKMSNILDKPLESVFGYITVLPGALSAYRYHALQNDENGCGPLAQYFKGETLHGKDADVFTANMYLAEDRILCWELVAKKSERWVLKYVRSATGETDVPDAVPEFVSQRRRWLNGAFFAAIYSLVHFRQVWSTDHTAVRKVLLHLEFIYQFVSLLFTFFSLANFYLMFYFIAGSLSDDRLDPFGHGWGSRIFVFLRFLCILLICTQFILCMGNRPQGAKRMFMSSMVMYGIIMAYTTFCSCYIVIKSFSGNIGGQPRDITIGDNIFTNLIVSTGSTIGVYFLMSFLYLDPWHMFTSSLQYFMMLPSYICTLQVYAFCNTHDVSWGTKGDNKQSVDLGAAVATKNGAVELEMPSEQLDIDSGYDEALRNLRDRLEVEQEPVTEEQIKEDYYRAVRTYVVVVWMVSNAVLAMIITEAYKINDVGGNNYLKFTLWSIAVLAVYRMLGSGAYLVLQAIHGFVEGKVKLEPERIKERWTQPAWRRRLGLGRPGGGGILGVKV